MKEANAPSEDNLPLAVSIVTGLTAVLGRMGQAKRWSEKIGPLESWHDLALLEFVINRSFSFPCSRLPGRNYVSIKEKRKKIDVETDQSCLIPGNC